MRFRVYSFDREEGDYFWIDNVRQIDMGALNKTVNRSQLFLAFSPLQDVIAYQHCRHSGSQSYGVGYGVLADSKPAIQGCYLRLC
jgi:hypothetical protein